MLTLIAARAADGAIGLNGHIPWRIPADMAFFRRETMGGTLIMGRKTFESLPGKLVGRSIIVVSSRPVAGQRVASSPDLALKMAAEEGVRRIYGAGGARVYKDLMPYTDRVLITEVECKVAAADTFFPSIPPDFEICWRRQLSGQPFRSILCEYRRRDHGNVKNAEKIMR